jgi:hypothetical protein
LFLVEVEELDLLLLELELPLMMPVEHFQGFGCVDHFQGLVCMALQVWPFQLLTFSKELFEHLFATVELDGPSAVVTC